MKKKIKRITSKIKTCKARIKKLEKILDTEKICINTRKMLNFDLKKWKELLIASKDELMRLNQLILATKEQQSFNNYLDSFFESYNKNKN